MEKNPDDNMSNTIAPHIHRCACGTCHNKRVANGTAAEYSAWTRAQAAVVLSRPPRTSMTTKFITAINDAKKMPQGDTDDGFLKNLIKTVHAVNYDDKCPHGLPFYACMPCSH